MNKLRLPNGVGGWATAGAFSAASGVATCIETCQST
jgi:hypothetical protein